MSDQPPPPPPTPSSPGRGGPRWQAPSEPPPPPPLGRDHTPPPPDDGGSRITGIVVGIAVAIVVLAAAAWGALTLFDADPVATPTLPTAAPTAPETIAPGTSDPSPEPSPSESLPGGLEDLFGEGGLEDLLGEGGLEDLLGGEFDPAMLTCLAPPDGAAPSLDSTPLPDDTAEAIRAIGDQVAKLRGLAFTEEVDLELLSREQLAERVGEVVTEDYEPEDARVDQAVLATLGQIPDDLDLQATYRDLLTEQVAGFYDPETGELVAQGSADLAPADRVIVAHELDHALTDQALGLPELDNDDDLDAVLARQGLVEGDATVLMQQWAGSHLSLTDQLGMAVPQTDTQALDSAPHVLQQQLLYPYTSGMSFVCSQYNDGGWAAVDAMYDDLPTTTAQVLWPERYRAGEEAVAVPEADLPGADELRSTTWGAADLLWLLEAPGNDPSAGLDRAEMLAQDWAGGNLTAWEADAGTTVTLQVAQQVGGGLCDTMDKWYTAAFPGASPVDVAGDERAAWDGGGRAAGLTCDDDLVTVTVGPDLATVRSVETG